RSARNSDAIAQRFDPGLLRAVVAAEERAVCLEAVADDRRRTDRAARCHLRDRALETVEGVGPAAHRDLERLVVAVATLIAGGHVSSSRWLQGCRKVHEPCPAISRQRA